MQADAGFDTAFNTADFQRFKFFITSHIAQSHITDGKRILGYRLAYRAVGCLKQGARIHLFFFHDFVFPYLIGAR